MPVRVFLPALALAKSAPIILCCALLLAGIGYLITLLRLAGAATTRLLAGTGARTTRRRGRLWGFPGGPCLGIIPPI